MTKPRGEVMGRIFDISRGCFEDGPGLRTTVFLKGCNLNCPWCHNLEGKSFRPEIAFDRGRCIGCGTCAKVCRRSWPRPDRGASRDGWRGGCTACGKCAESCPSGARRLVGAELSTRQLADAVTVDMDFFDGTGGGVTFSGGEPLAQPEFVFECARILRSRRIHVALETSGHWPQTLVPEVVRAFDLILFDVKHTDPGKCRRVLGASMETALQNLEQILTTRSAVEVRITLVPEFNDGQQDLAAIAAWLVSRVRVPGVRLQPFHRMAAAKQKLLGRSYPYASSGPVDDRQLRQAAGFLEKSGIQTTTS